MAQNVAGRLVPSCPICTGLSGEIIQHAGERRYICDECNTVYVGTEHEWDASRDRRDNYAALKRAAAAAITAEPEPAGRVLGSLNEQETAEEPDGPTVDSEATSIG